MDGSVFALSKKYIRGYTIRIAIDLALIVYLRLQSDFVVVTCFQ